MNNRHIMYIIAAGVILALLGGIANLQAQNQGAKATSIAVVNTEVIAEQLDERIAIEDELKALVDKNNKWNENMEASIKGLQADLEVITEDTDDYRKRRDELQQKLVEYRVQREIKNMQSQQMQLTAQESLSRTMRDTIQRIANEQGFGIVMMKSKSVPKIRDQQLQQVAFALHANWVLYSAPELDITDQVVQRMNNEYNSRTAN